MANTFKLYQIAEDTLRVLIKKFNNETINLCGLRVGDDTNNTTIDSSGNIKLNGSSTVYKDLVFPLIQKATGVGNPTFAVFKGNIVKPQFAINDAIQLEPSEFIHEWLEGSNISLHIHWTSMTNIAAERAVKWELEYTYVLSSNGTNQWVDSVVVSQEVVIPANTPAFTEFITPITNFIPIGGKIGGQLHVRLKRIASAGTSPATNSFVTQVGAHIECDSFGSNNVATK